MERVYLQNDEWVKILAFLRTRQGVYVGTEAKCRRFLNGVLWVMRSGAQWRLLPESYGKGNSVYKRFARWCDKGIWTQLLDQFADEPDRENLIIDSTLARAHPFAPGAPPARGAQLCQALVRSRGAFPPTTHITPDPFSNPLPLH